MKVGIVYINDQPQLSVGIAYISAVLKKHGHQVKLWDTYYQTYEEVTREILESDINLLAIGVTTLNYNASLRISRAVKKAKPELQILYGGWHSVIDPEQMLQEESIDLVCVGEGEYAVLDIADGKDVTKIPNIWSKQDGNYIRNPPRKLASLDDLPIMDRDIFNKNSLMDRGKFFFSTGRGCPFACSYCCNKKMNALYSKVGSPYVRFRNVNECMKELKMIKEKYNPPEIFFTDEMFLISHERVREFCKAYIENKIGVPFGFMTRVESISDEIVKACKEAGCVRIHFGIESGNEEMRKKYLNRHMTNAQIIKAFDICHKHGIKTASFNMIALPKETKETIRDTLEINKRCKPDEIQVTILYPFPNTDIREMYEKDGLLNLPKVMSETGYYKQYITKNPNLSYAYIKHQQIFIELYIGYSKPLAYLSKLVPTPLLDLYFKYTAGIIKRLR